MSEPKRRAPAFPLYADDFLAGTAEMSAEEVGAYIRLLCHQWSKGGIPNDEDRAGRMAGLVGSPIGSPIGSPSLRYVLAKFSPCDDGQLRNKRLESIRLEKEQFAKLQAENGRRGAGKRWKNGNPNGTAIATPLATPIANEWPQNSSPSPSPSPYINEPPPHNAREVESAAGFMFPNLDDVKMFGSMQNIPEEFCEKFWLHYESTCWVDRNGNRITSWQAKLRGLWIKEQADISKGRNGNKPPGGERKEIQEKIQIRKAVFSGNE